MPSRVSVAVAVVVDGSWLLMNCIYCRGRPQRVSASGQQLGGCDALILAIPCLPPICNSYGTQKHRGYGTQMRFVAL